MIKLTTALHENKTYKKTYCFDVMVDQVDQWLMIDSTPYER